MGKKFELKIVFDTNGLYTKIVHDLLNKSLAELIRKESSRSDITLTWFCPQVVLRERQYQMQKAANELLPSMEKIEILIGHKLNITSDILAKRVEETIFRQIKEYKIEILDLDYSQIDLESMVERSCFRHLPFSQGKEEKGFRDAIIAESFFQLVDKSPKSPISCKIVFFTNDNDLKKHILEQLANNKNIDVLSSIEEIEGLINTLASDIDESTIKKYQDSASVYFFNPEKREGKFFSEKIKNKIEYEYNLELSKCPEGLNLKRHNKTWLVSPPQFIKKERARINWFTRIEIIFDIFTIESHDSENENNNSLSSIDLFSKKIIQPKFHLFTQPFGLGSNELGSKKIISKGKTIFEIQWSANLSANNKFTRFSSDKLEYIETILEE